jgi:hypothetical protein
MFDTNKRTNHPKSKGHCGKLLSSQQDQVEEGLICVVDIRNALHPLIYPMVQNQSLVKQLTCHAILRSALIEAIALPTLMMAFPISSIFRWNWGRWSFYD